MSTLKLLIASLGNQILAIWFLTNSSKSRLWFLVDVFDLTSTKSASIRSFPLLPFLTSVSTMIRFDFTFLAKIFSALVTSDSLKSIMSRCLFCHWFAFIIFKIQIDLSWFNTHLIITSLVWTSDWLIHVSNELFIQVSHQLWIDFLKILIW